MVFLSARNEYILEGKIEGPIGGAARNLKGSLLTMNIFQNGTSVHESLRSISKSNFPLNFTIKIQGLKNVKPKAPEFFVAAMVWQPIYAFQQRTNFTKEGVNKLDIRMRSTKSWVIRGNITHLNNTVLKPLKNVHVKLELCEASVPHRIIDQVDYTCNSTSFPCPFEYVVNTAKVKAGVNYQLQANVWKSAISGRNTAYQDRHRSHVLHNFVSSEVIKIDPAIDFEINGYQIVLNDS